MQDAKRTAGAGYGDDCLLRARRGGVYRTLHHESSRLYNDVKNILLIYYRCKNVLNLNIIL